MYRLSADRLWTYQMLEAEDHLILPRPEVTLRLADQDAPLPPDKPFASPRLH